MTERETGEPLVVQVMVKVDWVLICTDRGEPVEKSCEALAAPEASVPDGPVTVQESTPLALHESVVLLPGWTRIGLAEMVADGARTSTDAKDGEEEPPAPEQMT